MNVLQTGTGTSIASRLTPPSNLPLPLTSFVGRVQEIATLTRLLSETRLVTLTGAGGIGKSRLALRIADDARTRFAHGVWLVELAALSDPGFVAHAIAATLGVREGPRRPPLPALLDALQARELLLILDNCEHLASCGSLAETLLRRCSGLQILATSRESLGVSGEMVWRVPPLGLPIAGWTPDTDELAESEAVMLFMERARTVVPDLHLGDIDGSTVAQICRSLDGIPLALELAAARVRSLGIEQIAARLDPKSGGRLDLLTRGSRTALERQQTLRATMDWSYTLLSPIEQALFRRISVFAGGWSLGAAERVCADDVIAASAVLDTLSQLIDKSLVLVEGTERQARYGLLETLRQYAAAKTTAASEMNPLRDRHLAWAVDLVEGAATKLGGMEQAHWVALLEREHDNLRAALSRALEGERVEPGMRLAVALAYFWQIRGHRFRSEGRRWLETLLAARPDAVDALQAQSLNWAATFAAEQFDFERAELLHARGLTVCTLLGDRKGMALARLGTGANARRRANYAAATIELERSLALARDLSDQSIEAYTLRQLGVLAQEVGDFAAAERANLRALELFRGLGEWHQVGHVLDQLGEALRALGQHSRAQRAHEDGLQQLQNAGCDEGVNSSLSHLARLALARGDLQRAFALSLESLNREQAIGMHRDLAASLELVAAVSAAEQPRHACRLLGASEALRETHRTALPPSDRDLVEGAARTARDGLDQAEAAAEWQTGRGWSLAESIEAALAIAPPSEWRDGMTVREREVARLVARGLSNREIAERLVVSVRTTEAHVTHVLSKLGLRSRAQLAVWATEHGLRQHPSD